MFSPSCRIGNGGLSLRKKSAMLTVAEQANPQSSVFYFEDMYFCINMHLANRCEQGLFDLPDFAQAREFSVEGVFHPDPIGMHKSWHYLTTPQLKFLLDGISYIVSENGI